MQLADLRIAYEEILKGASLIVTDPRHEGQFTDLGVDPARVFTDLVFSLPTDLFHPGAPPMDIAGVLQWLSSSEPVGRAKGAVANRRAGPRRSQHRHLRQGRRCQGFLRPVECSGPVAIEGPGIQSSCDDAWMGKTGRFVPSRHRRAGADAEHVGPAFSPALESSRFYPPLYGGLLSRAEFPDCRTCSGDSSGNHSLWDLPRRVHGDCQTTDVSPSIGARGQCPDRARSRNVEELAGALELVVTRPERAAQLGAAGHRVSKDVAPESTFIDSVEAMFRPRLLASGEEGGGPKYPSSAISRSAGTDAVDVVTTG